MTSGEFEKEESDNIGNNICLEVVDVVKKFSTRKTSRLRALFRIGKSQQQFNYVTAVDRVSLQVNKGETLALLGESGSGKTTLGRLIVGLDTSDSGSITMNGRPVIYAREKGAMRGRLQMVFQDPGSSLDPFMKVINCVMEPLRKFNLTKRERREKAASALAQVGLDDSLSLKRASELSGGQRQRVAVARAIVSDPEVIVLDEPTSSIDVSIQAQVLNLLADLQAAKHFTYVLITHDANVAMYMADRVAVMYMGRIVEYGDVNDILLNPKHPYTQALLASRPKIDGPRMTVTKGEPPSLINLPLGCRYQPRCQFAMEKCKESDPPLIAISNERKVACYLHESTGT